MMTVKPYEPRYYVTTDDSWAWKRIFIALGKGDDDLKEIVLADGKTSALEVRSAEIARIEGARTDLGFSFQVYQELLEGGYARLEQPLLEKPLVRTTTDPLAHEAREAALHARRRVVTSPLRRDRIPVRYRGRF
jgi:hypothetical protein